MPVNSWILLTPATSKAVINDLWYHSTHAYADDRCVRVIFRQRKMHTNDKNGNQHNHNLLLVWNHHLSRIPEGDYSTTMPRSPLKKMNVETDNVGEPIRRRLSAMVADFCLDWVVFPALLFIQFGATMYKQMHESTLTMDWRVVQGTIFLFCLVAGVYRQVLRRHPWDSLVLLLLPELFTNILLGIAIFGKLEEAFTYLVSFTAVLSVLGLVAAGQVLYFERSVEPSSSDYQLLKEGEEEEDEWIC